MTDIRAVEDRGSTSKAMALVEAGSGGGSGGGGDSLRRHLGSWREKLCWPERGTTRWPRNLPSSGAPSPRGPCLLRQDGAGAQCSGGRARTALAELARVSVS